MERVINLKAGPAFLVVAGTFLLAGALGALAPDRYGFGIMNATAAVVYFGWPLLVGIAAQKRRGAGSTRTRVIATAAYPYVVILHVIAGVVLMDGIGNLTALMRTGFLALWLIGVVATFYLLWFGASSLVAAEERERSGARADSYTATLVGFLLLPVGVLWLQRRVRTLFAGE